MDDSPLRNIEVCKLPDICVLQRTIGYTASVETDPGITGVNGEEYSVGA
jgi:hypothetical protein